MITSTTSLEHYNQVLEENKKLLDQVKLLTERIEWFNRQLFGKKSEKIIPSNEGQLLLFELKEPPVQEVAKTQVPAHERKKYTKTGEHKISFPENLPVEITVLDVCEERKVCDVTGESLVKIGEEVTDKLAFRPSSYFIKRIVRPKYASTKSPESGILTADLPDSIFDRCSADESFLADMLTKKFADHLPLNRQSEILSREKIQISRQILCQWTIRCGEALKPLMSCMLSEILNSGNVFIDESPIAMLCPGKGKTQKGYMWVVAGGKSADPPYRIYDFFTNRRHCNAAAILKNYHGVVHSDKYGAYVDLALAKQFDWCPCWVHIRRKFFEAESGDPAFRTWILEKISNLFSLEEQAWLCSPDERLKIRKEQEIPIINEMITAIKERLVNGTVLPKSKLKEALGYFAGLIPYLKTYTNHPFARLDNNVAERAVRPLAIGRKNWLFFGNEGGGQAAAVIFSLVQTCRGLKINPREYLEDVMRRIMNHPMNALAELLPDRWLSAKNSSTPF